MPAVFNIRGTSGSGKSTIVYEMMRQAENVELVTGDGRVVLGHTFRWQGEPFAVIGKYTTPCGGCDAVPTQEEIGRRIRLFRSQGFHVIFEGLLVSGIYSRYFEMSREFEPDFYWLQMTTPLDECLRRINLRREARGDVRPLNPKNTISKYESVARDSDKARREGARVLEIADADDFFAIVREAVCSR